MIPATGYGKQLKTGRRLFFVEVLVSRTERSYDGRWAMDGYVPEASRGEDEEAHHMEWSQQTIEPEACHGFNKQGW